MTALQVLAVFARAPEAGRVKSRLAVDVGDDAALEIYCYLGARVVEAIEVQPSSWDVVVAGTPDWSEPALREWLGDQWRFAPQGVGDLGERMAAVFAAELARGAERVVLIGTDCPEVDASVVTAAFERLGAYDAVLGPATDGGYYLVGMRREAAGRAIDALFSGVPWSSAETLRTSRARAAEYSVSVALLGELADVDTAADWAAWIERAPSVDDEIV